MRSDRNQKRLPYLGLWVISVVMGGSVCINAMSFDAMRVRAALDSGDSEEADTRFATAPPGTNPTD